MLAKPGRVGGGLRGVVEEGAHCVGHAAAPTGTVVELVVGPSAAVVPPHAAATTARMPSPSRGLHATALNPHGGWDTSSG